MQRPPCIALLAAALFLLHSILGAKPNFLIILTDDQGWGDVSFHGNEVVDTPNLNRLAKESIELNQFHAAAVCAPTRASLMTGKQFLRAGVWGVHGGRDYLDLGETTLAQRLQKAGYRTGFAGKWHLGKTDAYLPWSRGFDDGWTQLNLYHHQDPHIDYNGRELRPRGWTVEILTDYALEWMTRESNQPFFFYLAHPYIHEPYFAPQPLIDKYIVKGLSESFATLCAMTEHLDEEIGRLLSEMERTRILKNTIVIFLGDNGPIGNPWNLPHLTEEEMAKRNPQGWKGMKGNLTENGTRVPAFVRWPDHFLPGISDQLADITDITPTVLDLAGVRFKESEFDGISLKPLLMGQVENLDTPNRYYANHEYDTHTRTQRELYTFFEDRDAMQVENQMLAMRKGDWKIYQGWNEPELYNIAEDPREQDDLSKEYPEVKERLLAEMRTWWTNEVYANPISYRMPIYPLPDEKGRKIELHGCAPTAIHGNVRQGNLFSHDWSQPGDGITWTVDVPSVGTYRVAFQVNHVKSPALLKLETDSGTLEFSAGANGFHEAGKLTLNKGKMDITLKLTNSSKIGVVDGLFLTRID